MHPQFWRGLGIAFVVLGLLLGAAVTGWGTAIFALLILGGFVFLAPLFFVARRAAGGGPETEGPDQEKSTAVSDPQAPSDATPEAPHGYTPST